MLIISLIMMVFSCKHEPFPPLLDDSNMNPTDTTVTNENLDPCDPDSVYFENSILPFIISSCAQPGCHNQATAEDNVILDSYENIIESGEIIAGNALNSELYETITDSDLDDRMPPDPEDPLTSEQIDMIYNWIQQGAQNNSCSSCDTNEVTFSNTIFPLVELKCQGCHSGGEPEANLSLENYIDINSIALNGDLLNSVNGTNGFVVMPFGGNPLSQCEIDQIINWINDGAPEN